MNSDELENLILEQITQNLNSIIRNRGLKQETLAETLGMQQSHLSEKLRGKNGIRVLFLIKLCIALEISFSELIGIEKLDLLLKSDSRNNIKEKRDNKIIQFKQNIRYGD